MLQVYALPVFPELEPIKNSWTGPGCILCLIDWKSRGLIRPRWAMAVAVLPRDKPRKWARPQSGNCPLILLLHGAGERVDDGIKPTPMGLGDCTRYCESIVGAVRVF